MRISKSKKAEPTREQTTPSPNTNAAPSAAQPPPTNETSVATQQRFESEVVEMWEAKRDREVEQANAHNKSDQAVFDAEERAVELTPSDAAAISAMTDQDLHKELVSSRNVLRMFCAKTQAHVRQRLIPRCEEMRKRFKRPGLKDRPLGLPTVEYYFTNILGLNYNTVRSWFARGKYTHREKLRTALFTTPQYVPPFPLLRRRYEGINKDFQKIEKLVAQIVVIGEGHDIDLSAAATDFLLIAGRQFATKGDVELGPKPPGPKPPVGATTSSEEQRAGTQ